MGWFVRARMMRPSVSRGLNRVTSLTDGAENAARRRTGERVTLTGSERSRCRRSGRASGQTLVEFSLVIPLFIVTLLAVLEFALLFNALLAINFASRDAALVAAEAGNTSGGDCAIIRAVEARVGAPANAAQIGSITIAWTDTNGVTKQNAGVPYSNVWQRGAGTWSCVLPDGTTATIPYLRTTNGYPEASRCNVRLGCGAPHTPSVDTIGVRVSYQYAFHTPLGNLLGPLGSTGGVWTLQQSNAMRMEPVL
jgi:Flp pilus assembly protein TadG